MRAREELLRAMRAFLDQELAVAPLDLKLVPSPQEDYTCPLCGRDVHCGGGCPHTYAEVIAAANARIRALRGPDAETRRTAWEAARRAFQCECGMCQERFLAISAGLYPELPAEQGGER